MNQIIRATFQTRYIFISLTKIKTAHKNNTPNSLLLTVKYDAAYSEVMKKYDRFRRFAFSAVGKVGKSSREYKSGASIMKKAPNWSVQLYPPYRREKRSANGGWFISIGGWLKSVGVAVFPFR